MPEFGKRNSADLILRDNLTQELEWGCIAVVQEMRVSDPTRFVQLLAATVRFQKYVDKSARRRFAAINSRCFYRPATVYFQAPKPHAAEISILQHAAQQARRFRLGRTRSSGSKRLRQD